VEVQHALQGKSKVLSRAMAEAMVEPVVPQFGRGFGIEDREGALYFQHGGWDEGFCAQLTARRDSGDGVAIMINSNHPEFIDEVARAVAIAYDWDGYGVLDKLPIPEIALQTYTGRYRYNAEQSFTISKKDEQLFMQYVGWQPQELLYTGDGIYVRRERQGRITFAEQDGALTFQFLLGGDDRQSHPRMGKEERLPREILAQGRRDEALAAYRKLKADEDDAASEGYLNNAGLGLIQRESHDLAVAVLEINCDLYPESANTWDSVGYAYRAKGDNKKAMEFYRKALEVDPKFPSALEAVAELQE
jgi:tetratricopeptide (TPR) repeat protein